MKLRVSKSPLESYFAEKFFLRSLGSIERRKHPVIFAAKRGQRTRNPRVTTDHRGPSGKYRAELAIDKGKKLSEYGRVDLIYKNLRRTEEGKSILGLRDTRKEFEDHVVHSYEALVAKNCAD